MLKTVGFYLLTGIAAIFSLSFRFLIAQNIQFQKVKIKSLRQELAKNNVFSFDGRVELLIDEQLHAWADFIEYDRNAQAIRAFAHDGNLVLVEDVDFLACSHKIFFDLERGTARAEGALVQLKEGFIFAREVVRDEVGHWHMVGASYTSCDHEDPHWLIKASSARLNPQFFHAKNMSFYLGKVPVFAFPRIVFPVQKKVKSGFLMPKLAFDYEHGPAWNQEYYFFGGKHLDGTLGVDWKHNRGIFCTQQLRWAMAPEKFGFFNGYYGFEENGFTQRQENIVPFKLKERYWFQGNYFYADKALNLLTQVDWGTDKKMSYQFFDRLEEVDDHFYNAMVARMYGQSVMCDLRADYVKTSRKRFGFITKPVGFSTAATMAEGATYLQELDNQVGVAHLPHLEVNSLYRYLGNNISYRNDVFCDQVLLREQETERIFTQAHLARQERIIPLTTADVWRFEYAGVLQQCCHIRGMGLNFRLGPHVSARSLKQAPDFFTRKNAFEARLFSKGVARIFCEASGALHMPEACVRAWDGYAHYFQPSIFWNFVPSIVQRHWFYCDEWDRFYPKNQLILFLRNNWEFSQVTLDCYVSHGYDFYRQDKRFYLQRGLVDKHLLPINLHTDMENGAAKVNFDIDIDPSKGRILQASVGGVFDLGFASCRIDYLYQNMWANQAKHLFSNVPHFITCFATVPLNRQASLEFGGNFYAEDGPQLRLRPLVHQIKFVYKGHCWGFYLGFEEKRYREYGRMQREPSLVFSLRFDSLGSFAKKFKTPYQATA